MNDYNAYKTHFTDIVDVVWFGHPGDTPHNIRTHRFIIKWHTDSPLAAHARSSAIEDEKVVLHWEYVCHGTCLVDTPDEDDSENSEASGDSDRSEAEVSLDSGGKPQKSKCQSRCHDCVKLVVHSFRESHRIL
jgi:hypothetical protein